MYDLCLSITTSISVHQNIIKISGTFDYLYTSNGLLNPKMKMLSLITYPHIVLNL